MRNHDVKRWNGAGCWRRRWPWRGAPQRVRISKNDLKRHRVYLDPFSFKWNKKIDRKSIQSFSPPNLLRTPRDPIIFPPETGVSLSLVGPFWGSIYIYIYIHIIYFKMIWTLLIAPFGIHAYFGGQKFLTRQVSFYLIWSPHTTWPQVV